MYTENDHLESTMCVWIVSVIWSFGLVSIKQILRDVLQFLKKQSDIPHHLHTVGIKEKIFSICRKFVVHMLYILAPMVELC